MEDSFKLSQKISRLIWLAPRKSKNSSEENGKFPGLWHMTITRIHGSCIATLWLQTLSDYAYLSDDSDFSRRISQIAPEEIPISSEERKNSSEESTETSEESNHKSEEFRHFLGRKTKISPEICPLPEKSTQLGRCYWDGTRIIFVSPVSVLIC